MLILTSGQATAGFLILTQLPATGSYSLLLAAVMPVGFGTAGTAFGTMVGSLAAESPTAIRAWWAAWSTPAARWAPRSAPPCFRP